MTEERPPYTGWADLKIRHSDKPASNVTRISRVIRRTCLDGTPQVISYHPGVGTSGSKIDQFTGGAFGMGLDRVSILHQLLNEASCETSVVLTGM